LPLNSLLPHAPPGTRWLLWAVFALHLLLGASLGLSVDEAHYLLYAAHPAWSYFDHPPLVGWSQWPLVTLGAPVALLRLLPGLLWLGTAAAAGRLAMQLAPAQHAAAAGQWAVLALLLAPLLHILGIGLLPDTLLMFLGVLLMGQTRVLMQPAAAVRPAQWLWLGLLLGLAGLSKYTAILAALAVTTCLIAAHGVAVLRNPWLWCSAALALLCVSPVLAWNLQNHWISFTYQAQHGAGHTWQGMNVLRFLLLQLLAYGPLLCWGGMGLRRVAHPSQRYLVLFFVIPFALLAALSGGGSGLPHWTAPAWVALAPFAGVGLALSAQSRARRSVLLLAAVQALLCLALPALMLSAGQPFLAQRAASAEATDPPNPFADLHGWDAAGHRARELAAQHALGSVSVQNWTLASRMGWYARPLPVHVLEDRFDQFDFWAGKLPPGGATLLVDWSQMPYVLPLGVHGFGRCDLLDTQQVSRWGQHVATFRFYACQGWSGDPRPQLQAATASPS